MRIFIERDPDAQDLPLPRYATSGSAGMDLHAAVRETIFLAPGERRLISVGIRLAIPTGYEAQVRPRSGLALRQGLTLSNSPGTIDSDFRATVQIILINLGQEFIPIERGDRIAQLVVAPIACVEWEELPPGQLPETARGQDGFDRLDINGTLGEAGFTVRDDLGLPREAYSLLAQANLYRMRGRWDEAVKNCMAALRLAPDSPSAQSLLGDIYENQGRIDDAVQWYRMALDANPDSPADRLKLNRLLERQQTPTRQIADERPAESTQAMPAQLSRLRQMTRDPETILRYGALIAAMLVLFTVAFAYGAVHHRAALAALGLGNSQEVQIKPVVVPSETGPASDTQTGVPHDAAEQMILDSLRRMSDLSTSGITVLDVQSDPRAGRLSVTVGVSSSSSVTRLAVLHSALQTIQDAVPLSPNFTTFTIRCLALPAGPDDTSGVSLVFVGDLPSASLPDPNAAAPDDTHLQALFVNAWWSPQMPS